MTHAMLWLLQPICYRFSFLSTSSLYRINLTAQNDKEHVKFMRNRYYLICTSPSSRQTDWVAIGGGEHIILSALIQISAMFAIIKMKFHEKRKKRGKNRINCNINGVLCICAPFVSQCGNLRRKSNRKRLTHDSAYVFPYSTLHSERCKFLAAIHLNLNCKRQPAIFFFCATD